MNLAAIEEMNQKFPDAELCFIESGGDNLAATFSPELADLTIYVIERRGRDAVFTHPTMSESLGMLFARVPKRRYAAAEKRQYTSVSS